MTNKTRLIDANAFEQRIIAETNEIIADNAHAIGLHNGLTLAQAMIINAPTVDAVEVVRCKDCKHYDNGEGIQWCILNSHFAQDGADWNSFPENGFCSYGERRKNADD